MTATEKLPTFGMRVHLAEEYECYPLGIFAAGMSGTVTEISAEHIGVTLDEKREELNEWDNCLHCDLINREDRETLSDAQVFWSMWTPNITLASKGDAFSALTEEYATWNKAQGLHLGSADEHWHDESLTEEQRQWVRDFSKRWDQVETGGDL